MLGTVPRVHLEKGGDKKGIVIKVVGVCANCLPVVDCGPARSAWYKSKRKIKAAQVIDGKHSHHEGSAK